MNKEELNQLEEIIISSYESGVTLSEAETLAARFLYAQMQCASSLRQLDLDSRMKKSSVKSIRAAVYLAEATKGDKKPSDVLLVAMVDQDELVQKTQELFDIAEVNRDEIERYYDIFREAHVHFRQVSKGRFE